MSDGWRDVRIGALVDRRDQRRGAAAEPVVLTCTEKGGLVRQSDRFAKRLATDDTSNYKLVEPLDIVYNPYLLWAGSLGQNLLGVQGITSPVYEVFRVREPADPLFVGLLLANSTTRPLYDAISVGSIPRRRRATAERFLDLPVRVPPLGMQRRIVDLVRAIEATVAAASKLGTESENTLSAWLNSTFEDLKGAGNVELGSMVEMASGASWSAAQERSTSENGTIPVVKITNTRPDGSLDMSERLYVTDLPAGTRLIDPTALILIRTNGNRARIGNVYRATPDVNAHAVSAFQIAAFPRDPMSADFIYWMLRAPAVQAAISAAASGTTGLGNVAIGWLRRLCLPWPGAEQRAQIVALAEAFGAMTTAARNYERRIRQFRQSVADQLLLGEYEIPDSYDVSLEA
jgi:type I restriction enzyme S subunit